MTQTKGSSAISRAPSGAQFHISAGSQRATIVEVGGGIREYVVDGRDVLDPYPLGAMCDGAHGAPLVPWPNRLADGAYSFDGNRYQLAINEPDKHNAIHGLLRWRNWQAIEHEPDRVLMATRLHPLTGYPFLLDVQIEYALSSAGLSVTTTATNEGEMACPYGSGQHPYLSPGTGLIDTCTLQLEAASWVDTANDRQLPTGTRATAGTPLTSPLRQHWASRNWTHRSSIWRAIQTSVPGSSSLPTTGLAPSSGSTAPTSSSSFTPATPSTGTDSGGVWALSP